MADKKDIEKIETIKEEIKKVKVKLLANVKYGEAIHNIGEKIFILESEVESFTKLNLVEKIIYEKEENEEGG
ncbi:hypothetical protein KPL47_06860 [Clostridium estertheticum]|uniref:hypothetical protein n=1 Tax=Clostridium estertheticum TaxID=238834 RepID=UPI001C0CAB5E|nr:hypothetical protein [Clostridium estertheticum]MBU3176087.1 hypothetical protein [Clostridium estertheticum]